MNSINEFSYNILEKTFGLVARLGLPLILAAWFGVLALILFMALVLRRHRLKNKVVPSILIGSISLTAHMVDYFGTISVTPDLAIEGNPIWRVVVDTLGLKIALFYGLSGKIFLSVLSFQFFLYYLVKRDECLPTDRKGFFDFWRRFGRRGDRTRSLSWLNIKVFFSFIFALIGPFCFYIALLNSISSASLYYNLPAMPIALAGYLIILVLIFLFGNYWSSYHRIN